MTKLLLPPVSVVTILRTSYQLLLSTSHGNADRFQGIRVGVWASTATRRDRRYLADTIIERGTMVVVSPCERLLRHDRRTG
jgi:hypothetical protein